MQGKFYAAGFMVSDFLAPGGQGQISPLICENTALAPVVLELSALFVTTEGDK